MVKQPQKMQHIKPRLDLEEEKASMSLVIFLSIRIILGNYI